MNQDIIKKCRKINETLIKAAVTLLFILLITQWYLRASNEGIEGFLNKLYIDEGISFRAIDVMPEKTNNINGN